MLWGDNCSLAAGVSIVRPQAKPPQPPIWPRWLLSPLRWKTPEHQLQAALLVSSFAETPHTLLRQRGWEPFGHRKHRRLPVRDGDLGRAGRPGRVVGPRPGMASRGSLWLVRTGSWDLAEADGQQSPQGVM